MAAELSRLRAENEQLRAQLSKVAGELRNQREDMKVSQGSPIAAPANLPPRFGSDALLKAVTQSLHEAGLSSAQVTSIDCSEYPCIIYGDGMNARLDSAKLQHAPSFAAYAKDNLRSFGWNMQFPPEGSRSDAPGSSAHWGLVVTPSDDPTPPDEMRKRLEYRTSLMRDAFPDAPGHKAAP